MKRDQSLKRRERPPFALRYFIASILLLVLLMGIYTFIETRRIQRDLAREMEEKGLALMEALETSGKSAIAASASQEEMLTQRLLDNAHLIDQILGMRGYDEAFIKRVAAKNRLQKVEILDSKGKPLVPSPGPPVGRGMMEHRKMMGMTHWGEKPDPPFPFMWGHRWHFPVPRDQEKPSLLPKPLQERKFWVGSDFGVAIPSINLPAYIVVHAEADYILKARRDAGVQRLMEDLGRRSGIAYVSLQGGDLVFLAHSDSNHVGEKEEDPFLIEALKGNRMKSRTLSIEGEVKVYEVAKPFDLSPSNRGVFRIGLSLEPIDRVWKQNRMSIILYTVGLLFIGILGVLAIFLNQERHLKEVRNLEKEVEKRERLSALGNMTATVAHEVRNPLNAISVGLQRLEREFSLPEGEEEREYIRFINLLKGEVKRLNGIVEGFLVLARPSKLALQECSILGLLKDVSALMGEVARSQGLTIIEDFPQELPGLKADPQQLKQALINIIQNGIQATPRGGNLKISARVSSLQSPVSRVTRMLDPDPGRLFPSSDFIEISVTDTGGGIPPENLPRVFDPYFTTREGGTGLGLSIAHRIIEAHGGSIEVESQAGEGTTFKIRLPVVRSGDINF